MLLDMTSLLQWVVLLRAHRRLYSGDKYNTFNDNKWYRVDKYIYRHELKKSRPAPLCRQMKFDKVFNIFTESNGGPITTGRLKSLLVQRPCYDR